MCDSPYQAAHYHILGIQVWGHLAGYRTSKLNFEKYHFLGYNAM
jgi:hypothetical protein